MRRRGEVELDVAEAELCEAGRELDLAWQRGRVGDIGLRRTEARRRDGVTTGTPIMGTATWRGVLASAPR